VNRAVRTRVSGIRCQVSGVVCFLSPFALFSPVETFGFRSRAQFLRSVLEAAVEEFPQRGPREHRETRIARIDTKGFWNS
jgi:hypothetical protein